MLDENFLELKSNLELNDTFDDIIQTRHNAVRSVIENKGINITKTQLIGSLQRKTGIQPLPNTKFDIDILVVMGEFYNWLPAGHPNGVTPQQALQNLHGTVMESDRYSVMNPQQDAPTVTIEYADETKVEFVPAYLDKIGSSPDGKTHTPIGRAYWIPKNGRWELADYDYEASYISKQNGLTNGLLIPVIKMLKAIKRLHFSQMDSFHIDVIATHIIPVLISSRKQLNQIVNYELLIKDFFTYSNGYLTSSVKIPGSHSPEILLDTFISTTIINKFAEIKKYIDNISLLNNDTAKIKAWRVLFGDVFPLT